jgi:hypothetical protein
VTPPFSLAIQYPLNLRSIYCTYHVMIRRESHLYMTHFAFLGPFHRLICEGISGPRRHPGRVPPATIPCVV